MARVLVLRAAGTNCDEETVHAFRIAGGEVESLHIGTLVRRERRLDEFDILVLPGGFAYGDDLGAGTVLANELRTRLADEFQAFVGEGRLVLGICNGFQVLVRLGILPGWGGEKVVSLVENASGRFEDRWVRLRVESERCPFLREAPGARAAGGPFLRLPVAHREGRFVVREPAVLERLRERGQIALTYCRAEPLDGGGFAPAGGRYPDNPNGSLADIAGITNERGNVLGLMPHPERFVHRLQGPGWTRGALAADPGGEREGPLGAGDGRALFARAVGFLDDRTAPIR